MSLTEVQITSQVWLTCVTHALSTESEEIMGLLLGDVLEISGGRIQACIWGVAPQSRSDRRKDRVETNPEQLAAASAEAERISIATGRTTRVIGWYHSHPHITVLPSHVDVRTQGMYQMLDAGFVGIIFSCFNSDAGNTGRIQAIAFQSMDASSQRFRAPTFSGVEVDSPRLKEALIRSNQERSEAEFLHREIPLEVVGGAHSDLIDATTPPLVSLQRMLFSEEQSAYRAAIQASCRNGEIHPLSALHHSCTYQSTLLKLIEYCLVPTITAVEDKVQQNRLKIQRLQEQALEQER